MYLCLAANAVFLALVQKDDSPQALSVLAPTLLLGFIIIRMAIWVFGQAEEVPIERIRRRIRSALVAAVLLSSSIGIWGYLLLQQSDPTRTTPIALFVLVGAVSCAYCLQALPIATYLALILGAGPVTASLLFSGDWQLAGIALNFIVIAALISRIAMRNQAVGLELMRSRSEISSMLHKLQSSEAHYRYSVELNPQMPWISDPDGFILEVSPRWAAITGSDPNEAAGWGWTAWVHEDDLPVTQQLWKKALDTGEAVDVRYRVRGADGSYRWYRARAHPRRDEAGNCVCWYGTLEDIHDHVLAENALRESEERYRLATRATNDLIFEWSHETNRIAWADDVEHVFGHPITASRSSQDWWVEHIHPEDRAHVLGTIDRLKHDGQRSWAHEYRFRTPTGDYRNIFSRGYVISDTNGAPGRTIGAMLDITTAKRVEEELRWTANHDHLTRLPNRKLFGERLQQALDEASVSGGCVSVTVIDVDDFKLINDDHGHSTGDHVLTSLASRISGNLPEGATLARLGGDEFAVIIPGLSDQDSCAIAVEKCLQDVHEPMKVEAGTLCIGVSAGSAIWPFDGHTAEDILKSADLALYSAKADGGKNAKGFEPAMRIAVETKKTMLLDAQQALEDDRIIPFYQAKVELTTGRIVGFEALLRWHHHRNGLQPPQTIKAAFDDPSLATQLTERMIDRVLADVRYMVDNGVSPGRIAINASTADFRKPGFADRILEKMHLAGVLPAQMEVEVTENVLLGQVARMIDDTLRTLANEGVTIALDDFGTGYASLTHLHQFPVHTLKIDQSFISRQDSLEGAGSAIVHGIIDIAQRMNIVTVAEGIETEEQFRHLRALGCNVGQGYLFSRPISAARLPGWIDQWRKSPFQAVGNVTLKNRGAQSRPAGK